MELKTLLNNLKKEIQYKWKIQTTPKGWKSGADQDKKWQCVAYIDARDCMDVLDKFCEEGWQSEYYLIRDTVFCKVWIKINWEWIWRSDAGSKPDENSWDDAVIKWEASDAFKRACVQWGIWRFLYEKDFVWISYADYNSNKYKLTEFCNKWKTSKNETENTDEKEWFWFDNWEKFKTIDWNFKDPTDAIKEIRKVYGLSNQWAYKVEHYYRTWEDNKLDTFPKK